MPLAAADVIAQLSATLRERGYQGLTTPLPDSGQTSDAFARAMSAAAREFSSHPLIGYAEDGLPVVGQDETECLAAIEDLTQKAQARGQRLETMEFVVGRRPVFDGPTGPKLGYEMRPLALLPTPPLLKFDPEAQGDRLWRLGRGEEASGGRGA